MPGPQEWMVIAIVALLVFGPDRLPEFARNAARFIVKLRTEARRNVEQLRATTDIAELEREFRDVRKEFDGATKPLRDAAGRDPGPGSSHRNPAPGQPRDSSSSGPSSPGRADSAPTDPEAT